jgi:DNA ligase-1
VSIPFADLADASARLAGTRSRLEKKRILVEVLARTAPDEVPAAVGWLIAEPLCGPLGVGPAQLWALSSTPAAERPTLTVRQLEHELASGRAGGREATAATVERLFARMTASERAFFTGALTASLRQGSLGGVMLLALAERSGQEEAAVRRSAMLAGSIPRAAQRLLAEGAHGAPPAGLTLFRAIAPMLAAPADSLEAALDGIAAPLVEWKIDGVRAQVHKQGARVAVFSRQGNDITAGCGDVVSALASLRATDAVLDGELVLVGPDGAPRPFQDSFSVIASKMAPRPGDRLRAYLFDCLYLDGVELLDAPLAKRRDALRTLAPVELIAPGIEPGDGEEARRFYAGAIAGGQEGVMVKDLSAPYRLGARGRAWQKVKESSTVDLVVLAAEWGGGRRRGFLSNLHLGARREDGTFCMVGKTFKGLTDELLRWQTERLQQLETRRDGHVVHVRPELVVEIRYGDVQRSPRYPGGVALRFARVVRYREDKAASEADLLSVLVARLPPEAAAQVGRQLPLFPT